MTVKKSNLSKSRKKVFDGSFEGAESPRLSDTPRHLLRPVGECAGADLEASVPEKGMPMLVCLQGEN